MQLCVNTCANVVFQNPERNIASSHQPVCVLIMGSPIRLLTRPGLDVRRLGSSPQHSHGPWAQRSKGQAYHLSPSCVDVKSAWICTSTPAVCRADNFTLLFHFRFSSGSQHMLRGFFASSHAIRGYISVLDTWKFIYFLIT